MIRFAVSAYSGAAPSDLCVSRFLSIFGKRKSLKSQRSVRTTAESPENPARAKRGHTVSLRAFLLQCDQPQKTLVLP